MKKETMYISLELELEKEKTSEHMIEIKLCDCGDFVVLYLPTMAFNFETEIKLNASEKLKKDVKVSYVGKMEFRYYTYREFMKIHHKI